MTIYNLDQTPNTFIGAVAQEGSFIYRLCDETNKTTRDIDLRVDKVIIYGTEIEESIREKLHMSLLLKSGSGRIFVNCNGACFVLVGSSYYYLLHNVIFDWSRYGVIVPNSVYDVLKKQLQHNVEELAAMNTALASAKGEASANKEGWESSKLEIEKLTNQLSTCRKEQFDKDLELQKVSSQLSVKEFELNATRNQFELFKREVMELQDQAFDSKKDYKNIEMELQTVKYQLSSTVSELNSTKAMWEFSKEQLVKCMKENEDAKVKLQSMQDVSSSKNMKELESQLLSHRKEIHDDIVTELQKITNEPQKQITADLEMVKYQLCKIMNELQSLKVVVDFTAKEVDCDEQDSEKCHIIKAIEIIDDQSKRSNKDME